MYRKKAKMTKKQKALIKKMAEIGPFIEGSLSTVYRICGRESCACMKEGKKHPAMFFTWKDENQKTKSLYVPVSKQKNAIMCNKNYKKLKVIIKKFSDIQKKVLASPDST